MKQTNRCPKCNGDDILRIEGKHGTYAGNSIQVNRSIFSSVLVHRYLCCSCGYSEEWIDKKDLQRLKARFVEEEK